jgi:hypothetical protein
MCFDDLFIQTFACPGALFDHTPIGPSWVLYASARRRIHRRIFACPDALSDQTSACPDASARRRTRTYLHVLMRICLSRPLPVLMRFLITLRLSDFGSSWV